MLAALIFAFIVTAAALDSSKEIHNKKLPKVVSIEDNGEKICTGVMIFDQTILTMSQCFVYYQEKKFNLTIKFPNDNKSYKTKLENPSEGKKQIEQYDSTLTLLTLDKKDNPPKSEWTFQIPQSDKKGGKGQMILIHNDKDKDEAKVIDLTVEKCNIETPPMEDLSSLFCSKGEVTLETDFVDRGAPLLLDGILTGVIYAPGYPGRPIVFYNFFLIKDFLKKLSKDLSGNKKHEIKGEKNISH